MLLALILKAKKLGNTGPTLIVAPLSLLFQWQEEIETKTSLSHRVHYGEQARIRIDENFEEDVVLTTYGTMQAELQKRSKQKEGAAVNKGLLEQSYLRVILDEGHCKFLWSYLVFFLCNDLFLIPSRTSHM